MDSTYSCCSISSLYSQNSQKKKMWNKVQARFGIDIAIQKWKKTDNLIISNSLIPLVLVIMFLFLCFSCAKCESSSLAKNNNNTKYSNITQQLILYSLKINSTNTSTIAKTQVENYKVNTRNLERVSRMIHDGRMKSACSISGLWAIFYSRNYQNIAAVLYASSNKQDQTCTQNQLNETNYVQYKSVRYIGNSNLLQPGLSLYKGPFFTSDELYFNGKILSLPIPQLFQSYGFTGNDSWTLYEYTNFSGPAICLMASGGNHEDLITNTFDRVVYNKNKGVNFTVGSIQKGCTEQSNRTLIFPSGETIVQRTNKPIGFDINAENNLELSIHKNELPSLKLISEIDGNILTTDASELRLPEKYTFNRFIVNTGENAHKNLEHVEEESSETNNNKAWTGFSGFEFTGKSKCFKSSKASPNNNNEPSNDINNANANANPDEDGFIETFDSRVPYRQDIFLVGSIKNGCFESNDTEDLPTIELHLSDDEDYKSEEQEDSIFFTSFIIGLILLIIVILLSIIMIAYFYIRTRRKQKREQRLTRAMRS